jgi:hypothetical protein
MALFRDELLLQVATWARKFRHLHDDRQTKEDLARLFIDYANRIAKPGQRMDPDRLTDAANDVCMRLILGARPRKGISTALGRADTFRSYIRRAITFAMKPSNPPRTAPSAASSFPQSIDEARARLGVSFSTVYRRLLAGGWTKWCREAWDQIRANYDVKAARRAAERRLQDEHGKTREAARKAVYRASKAGRNPDAL